MTDNTQLKEDIAYVRAVAERSRTKPVRPIYLLWAMIGLCGFVLVDFVDDKKWISIYWLFAAPIGFALSFWLGFRAGRNQGATSRETGIRHSLHWLAFMTAGVLGLALVHAGQLTWQGFGSLWVLLLALTYFQLGLHLERRLLPIGVLMGAGYLVTVWVPKFGWTATGVVLAIALVTGAYLGAPKSETAG